MTDLTEDERELLRLVNGFDDGLWGKRRTAHWFRILAHYRKAKAEAKAEVVCGGYWPCDGTDGDGCTLREKHSHSCEKSVGHRGPHGPGVEKSHFATETKQSPPTEHD